MTPPVDPSSPSPRAADAPPEDAPPGDAEAIAVALRAATAAGPLEATLEGIARVTVENARLAEQTERRCAWLQAGSDVATALLSGSDPAEVLRTVAARVSTLADADLTGVLMPSPGDDGALTIVAGVGEAARDLEGVRVPLDTTHVGRVHRAGVAAIVDDTSVDPVVGEHAEVAVEITHGYGPGLMVPLTSCTPAGMIVALRMRDREPFDRELLDPLATFAAQVSVSLTTARARVQENRRQVQADRDRIARDLHDQVVQRIFATTLALDRLGRSLEDRAPEAAEGIARSVDELHGTIAEIRAAIFELHHDGDDRTTSLPRQVADVVHRVTEGHGLRPTIRARGALDDVPLDLVADLLAVVRELVTNVVRHASASKVTVALTVDDEARVVVTDNGVGLPDVVPRSGLANLAERAERRGGRVFAAGGATGTEVRWVVPLRS